MPGKVITSASGYESLQATPLGTGVVYGGMIRDRNWEEDLIPYISNTSVLDDLIRCGQVLEFRKPPRVGSWRTYEKNQNMVSDQVTSDTFCLTICNADYKSIKFDKLDIWTACEHWEEFESAFLEDAWRQLSNQWQRNLLNGMILQASSRNTGVRAGRYNNINLGTVGTPLELTPENLLTNLAKFRQVLSDAGRWYEGEMFMIVPNSFDTLMAETIYAKQWCCDPSETVLIKGFKAKNIQGFTVYESDKLRPTVNPTTNRLVYPLLFGWTDAYGFSGDIIEAELKPAPGNTFGVVYNMLSVYGGGVIYPEALARAYVSLSTDGIVTPAA